MTQPVEAKKKKKDKAPAAPSPVPSTSSPSTSSPSTSSPSPSPAATEAAEKAKAKEKAEAKAREKAEKEAKEKAEKEKAEKEKAEKEKAEKEKAEKEKAEKEKEKEKEEKELAKGGGKKKSAAKQKRIDARLVNARKTNERKSNARKKLKEKLRKAKEKEIEKEEKLRKQKAEDDTPENRKHGEEKRRWLEKQSAAASYGLISLDTEAYKEYVNNGPRPYWLLVEYTALHPSSRCGICETMNNVIRPVSQSMWARRDIIKEKWVNQSKSEDAEYYPIFFVQVDVQRNQQLFGQLQLNSAPLVSLIPPKTSNKKVAINQLLPKLKKYRFTAISATMTTQDIGDFVFKLTKLDVELDVVINYTDIFAIVALGALALFVVYAFGETMRQHRYFFFGAVLFAYLYCIAGGVYNHLRNTPWSQQQGDQVVYIARQSRGQYSAETWILVLIVGAASFFGVQANRTMWREATTKKSAGGWLIPAVYSALFGVCYYLLLYVYNLKTWGYNMGWVI